MAACDAAAFWLLLAHLSRTRPSTVIAAAWAYVLATASLEHLLYDRLDSGLLALLVLFVFARGQARAPDTVRDRFWTALSYFALGFAVAYKFVPAVMVPFVLLGDVVNRHSTRSIMIAMIALCIGAAGPFAVYIPSAGPGAVGFLQFHVDRGIEIESIYAVMLRGMAAAGMPLSVADRYETIELRAPYASALVTLSNVLSVALPGALGLHAIYLGRRYTGIISLAYSVTALLTVVVVAKGLSPQYFIWIIPMLLLAGAELFNDTQFRALCARSVAMAALTTVIYPLSLVPLLTLDPRTFMVLGFRNFLFAALVTWIAFTAIRRAGAGTTEPPSP
jgi:hypothetical protein